jgi:hypothetical protein
MKCLYVVDGMSADGAGALAPVVVTSSCASASAIGDSGIAEIGGTLALGPPLAAELPGTSPPLTGLLVLRLLLGLLSGGINTPSELYCGGRSTTSSSLYSPSSSSSDPASSWTRNRAGAFGATAVLDLSRAAIAALLNEPPAAEDAPATVLISAPLRGRVDVDERCGSYSVPSAFGSPGGRTYGTGS